MNRKIKKLIKGLFFFIIGSIMAIPFYLLILLSLKSPTGGMSAIRMIPDFYITNILNAWNHSSLGVAIFNNGVITTGAVCLLIILSSMAGYSITRVKSILNKIIFTIFLVCMMIPGIINTVPLYTLLIKIKGINTYWAMICVLATNSLPFSIFLYSQFVKTVPISFEESALMDGCSQFKAFRKIIFPLLKPVTASIVILQGLGIWNNYAQAVFILQNQKMRTIPLAISLFFQQYGANWPEMAAAAFIGMLPTVIVFLSFQKHFISGIATGAIKG